MELKEVYLGAEKSLRSEAGVGHAGWEAPVPQPPESLRFTLAPGRSFLLEQTLQGGWRISGWGPAIWVVPGSWPGPALAFAGIPRLNQQSTLSTLSLK